MSKKRQSEFAKLILRKNKELKSIAKRKNQIKFIAFSPCLKCNTSIRYVRNNGCVECTIAKSRKWIKKNRVWFNNY